MLARSTCRRPTTSRGSASHLEADDRAEVRLTCRMPATVRADPVRTDRCRPRRHGSHPVVATRRLRAVDGARSVDAHGRMPRPVLPCGMRQPGEETDAARSEALAGNPARLPRGNAADAHVRVLDHVRRGSRSRGDGDRATGCRFDRPAQRHAVEGPRHTRDAKGVLSAGAGQCPRRRVDLRTPDGSALQRRRGRRRLRHIPTRSRRGLASTRRPDAGDRRFDRRVS